MSNPEMNVIVEWKYKSEKSFSVTAKGWWCGSRWNWNVYAYIYESHSLFLNPEAAKSLPLHCGCTYDSMVIKSPLCGIEYDWQKETKHLLLEVTTLTYVTTMKITHLDLTESLTM